MISELNKIPFIGNGWSFPPQFDKGKRGVEMSAGAKDIEESLRILLSTKAGERIMHPEFGCDLNVLLFEPLDLTLKKNLEDHIKTAIINFEPRILADEINFEFINELGVINIEIKYTIKLTNTRTNIVYPFYLSEGTNL